MKQELSAEVHTDVRAFTTLKGEWNYLLQKSGTNTPFLTWEWQRTWWDRFGAESQLSIVSVRDEGDLVGLAPFFSSSTSENHRTLQLVGGIEVSDYLDLLVVADNRATEVYTAIWQALTNDTPHSWHVLDLHNIPASSPTLQTLPAIASAAGEFQITSEVEEVCPVITLPSTWDQYLSLLNKKQRHEVRRKLRKANREATLSWYYAEDPDSLDHEVDDFISLHHKSGAHKKTFMGQGMQGFFRDIAHAAFDAKWLRLAFLVVNDVKVASMFCFDFNENYLVYNSGYDPNLYSSLSTGIVLLAYCIRDAVDSGRRVFDFLRGEEEYKYRFGGVRTEIHNLRLDRRQSDHV
jgi:CelD/BcsL family acetyltransferase involved in cellulose biosynthesis